jgi:hypothetical protein
MSKSSLEVSPHQRATDRRMLYSAWTLSAIVSSIAIVAWGSGYGYKLFPINNYHLFPLLGLLAFSIMWGHYMVGAVSDMVGVTRGTFKKYYQYTGYAVLTLICLHPGLLIYQRFRDGFGLPPHSYETYVAPGLGWITLLGTASFCIFIAFEFRRIFGKKSWWHFVVEAGDFAMLAILYHGFKLGGQLVKPGWFQEVWLLYAATLVAVLIRSYRLKYLAYQAARN